MDDKQTLPSVINSENDTNGFSEAENDISFIEETHTKANFSLKEDPFSGEIITIKRELDDFENRQSTNEIDQDWDQKPTVQIHSHVKSEQENLKTHSELDCFLKKDPVTVEHITVKEEQDDFDIREAASEVDQDLDQKYTIKNEEEDFINKQYLINHEEVDIKSDNEVEQSGNRPKNHKVSHKFKDQMKIHQCPECPYQSKRINDVKKHSVRHKKPDEIVWHRCTQCPYQTTRLKCLEEHQLKHESTDKWHACPQCPFKTIRKGCLIRHVRTHVNPAQLEWYVCEQCPYKTYRKQSFKEHAFIHNEDHPKWQKCVYCSFKTLRKNHLRRHQMKHQDEDGHKCPEYPHKVLHKASLQRDVKNHKAVYRTDWLQCPECSYRSLKHSLGTHMKMHPRTSQDKLT